MHRVILHAMTLNRDAPSMIILAKLLEKMGCKVLVSSVRNYLGYIKYWRPHAVLCGTLSKSNRILDAWPKMKLFYCAGEGGESKNFMDENYYLKNEHMYDRTSSIFVWGNVAVKNLLQRCEEEGKIELAKKIIEDGKVIVSGHPRLDLLKHMPRQKNESTTIGINTSLNRLNTFDGRSAVYHLFSKGMAEFERVKIEMNEAEVLFGVMEYIVKNTNFNISLRPYPLENKLMYRSALERMRKSAQDQFQGRVELDDTLDYGSWVSKQRLVVNRVSTTLSEAYFLGIPMVFIDKLAGNWDFYHDRSEVQALLLEAAVVPSTLEELYEAVSDPDSVPVYRERLKEFWAESYGLDMEGSSLVRIAETIVSSLDKDRHSSLPLLPRSALRAYDALSFYRIMRGTPCHANFNYKEGYHLTPPHYDEIMNNMLTAQRALAKKEAARPEDE